jgi:hypothetical protein
VHFRVRTPVSGHKRPNSFRPAQEEVASIGQVERLIRADVAAEPIH